MAFGLVSGFAFVSFCPKHQTKGPGGGAPQSRVTFKKNAWAKPMPTRLVLRGFHRAFDPPFSCVLFPSLLENHSLSFCDITSKTRIPWRISTPPIDITSDLQEIPLLGVEANGNRLGNGTMFYGLVPPSKHISQLRKLAKITC